MKKSLTETIDLMTAVNSLLTEQRSEILAMQQTIATVKTNLQDGVLVDENELNLVIGTASQMMNNGSALVESIALLKQDVVVLVL